jgi:hypothetical protein
MIADNITTKTKQAPINNKNKKKTRTNKQIKLITAQMQN